MIPKPPPVRPTFSIIIPTRNRARTLPRTIASALSQTYGDFEVIVVDDGSDDDTLEVVGAIEDCRLRHLTQRKLGRSAARNAGVRAALGNFVTFLDSDDEVLANWLADFDEGFSSAARVGIVCTGYRHREAGRGDRDVMPRTLGAFFGAEGQRGLFMAQTFSLRRELFLEVGGYAEALSFSENTELAMRLVPHCLHGDWQIVSLDRVGSIYHVDRPGDRSLQSLQMDLESSEYILEQHRDRLDRVPRIHALYLGTAGVRAARLGDFRKARALFARGVAAYPRNVRNLARCVLATLPWVARRVWDRQR